MPTEFHLTWLTNIYIVKSLYANLRHEFNICENKIENPYSILKKYVVHTSDSKMDFYNSNERWSYISQSIVN